MKETTLTRTLGNGLRVLAHHNPLTQMSAVNILYGTGSRDESPEKAGIAHLFEHLMFGGSRYVDDFSAEISNAGGWDNAWTSQDFTNFYSLLPAVNLETALRLESDRLLSPRLDGKTLDVQKKVVCEEFKQSLNRPYGDMSHIFMKMVYSPAHPYSWPVIGRDLSTIENISEEAVHGWFYSHYTPENAVLAISGALEAEKALDMAEKWFGDIPRRDTATRNLPSDVFNHSSEVQKKVTGKCAQSLITMAYPIGGYGSSEYVAGDLLTDILSDGRSSRLTSRLVYGPERLFNKVEASVSGLEHAGLLVFSGMPVAEDEATVERAIRALETQAQELCLPGNITDEELQRALNKHEATRNMELTAPVSRATAMALAEYHHETIDTELDRLRQLDLDALSSSADQILQNTPYTLIYRPSAEAQAG